VTARVLTIVGPTATGKTRMGVRLAHALGSEIVSADSRQTYRGLDIGSGKDLREYAAVSPPIAYHLVDVADPAGVYSIFHYQRDCFRLLERKAGEQPWSAGVPLVMVGGSGLYVESVLRRYRIPNVPEDVTLREELMGRDREQLVAELERADPELAHRTDLASKKRVVRALEIVRHARRGPLHYTEPPAEPIDHAVFALDVARETLHRRIDDRLAVRMREGLVEEVERLLASGIAAARMAQLGLEYREVAAYLSGSKTEPQMLEDLSRGIRRLAKRQLTWFRGFPRRGIDVTWIGPDDVDRVLADPWVRRRYG